MSIFSTNREKKLEKKVAELNDLVTRLRDEKIEAQISESRAQSGFNAQKELDRVNYTIKINSLESDIKKLTYEMDQTIELEVADKTSELEKDFENEKKSFKKSLKEEFGSKIETLEKNNKNLETENSKNKGLYDGALIVIKSLEKQLEQTNKLNETLVKALPEVKANLTGGNQSVTVNK